MNARESWNKTTTELVSSEVGGAVEVTLKNNTINIYTEESRAIADSALLLMKKAGSELVSYSYYEAGEDGGEAWVYEVTL